MADADVIVVGAGLAGLVAACEVLDKGRSVLIVDQENAANLGGQAFWSFGGLFYVDSPEQRRLGIRDSHELALQDWLGTAGFDRPLASAVGARVRRLCGRGEAQLVARTRTADLRPRRLGGARRL
jgi:predicted oxidoreductase